MRLISKYLAIWFGDHARKLRYCSRSRLAPLALGIAGLGAFPLSSMAQVNVLTGHNDAARTGQNLNETILTPANVNAGQFGKLFSWWVNGGVYPQPLYVSHVTVPNKGVHNVVYVGTTGDTLYAFDADSNGGVDAAALWQANLLTNTTPAGTYTSVYGICGTPVIDLSTNTMYLFSSEETVSGSSYIYRFHALDITTGAEKFGGPATVHGSVPGTGAGSVGGTLAFNAAYQKQRPSLLLQNGVVYGGFGSVGDNGPWHGWLFSYNAATLQQLGVLCLSSNGSGVGVWQGGAGLAGEVNDPNKPYGRLFLATGNGSFSASSPYNDEMSYGMSVLDVDLSGGAMTVSDEFTASDWLLRNGQDGDLGSGGPILLPAQTLASGQTVNPLIQIGKTGTFYILNRDNLGGFNSIADAAIQEVQTSASSKQNWGAGIWGTSAYWNQNIFYGGTNPGAANPLTAYTFINGQLSSAPTSQSVETFPYPGPTPSVSSSGNQNGIVWVLNNSQFHIGPGVLLAYDAANLANTLYSSNINLARDTPGGAIEFTVPTVANGKVYVGEGFQFTVYGLLSTPTAVPPVFNPPPGSFSGVQTVSISSQTPNSQIYYSLTGASQATYQTLYTGPITLSSTATITAVANASGYVQSSPVSATFTALSNAGVPIFSLAPGTYAGAQTFSFSDASAKATVYYTVDGTTPTTASASYTGTPISIPVSETVQAFATAPGLLPSPVVSAAYDIDLPYAIDFSAGFATAQGPIQFNGSSDLDDLRLQLTNGAPNEAGSAFFATPVNIQSFTTDFTLQLSNPAADGMTFTIQNVGPGALGSDGGSLGYAGIGKSVAIKFDLFSNVGEGSNSTGLYVNGAQPTQPSNSLVGTGINLHDGDFQNVHITYDGATLQFTITDAVTLTTWSHAYTVNIPSIVGGPTAYVGFTGADGGLTSSQKVLSWTYLPGNPPVPNYPVGFGASALTLNGAASLAGATLLLTNGGANISSSAYYPAPVGVDAFTTDFDFSIKNPRPTLYGDGFTFILQNKGLTAIGGDGGGLGYVTIPNSVAIKFDLLSNAGEGSNSTGSYIDGAMPTIPAINLTPSGVVLSSGDKIHAHITYDGTTLTWTLTDTTLASRPSATNSVVINIPHILGGNTGYVGFTGGSGGAASVQQILDWTYATISN